MPTHRFSLYVTKSVCRHICYMLKYDIC